MKEKEYVGFFDSGVGGMTVLKEVKKKCPNLDIVYFGDNKNAPYGQKSQEEIIFLTKDAFLFLKEKGCGKIVTACNSVSAVVNEKLAKEAGIERKNIIEMSAPTMRYCVENNLEKILVLSTEATKKSALYTEQFLENKISVESVAVNGLVDLIESGASEEEKEKVIKKELKKNKKIFQKVKNGEFESIILACTHFPLVEEIFKKVFLVQVGLVPNFINPAVFVADEVLEKFLPVRCCTQAGGDVGEGERKFYFSKDSQVAEKFVKEILR